MTKDIRRAEAGLAGPEREKLQSYLEAFQSMRERHDKLVAMEAKLKSKAPPVIGKHGIGHGGSYNGMTWDVMATKIRKFHFELIARTIRKLQSVPEGDGTMFDNTLVVYLSDAAEGHHSRCWGWPMVLIGNLGGKLKCGRYLEWPGHGANGHRHIGNLYTTFLNAVGDNRETFGQRDPLLEKEIDQLGPCEELLV